MEARYIKSGKVIKKPKLAAIFVKAGIAEYIDDVVEHEDDDLEDQVFAPVDDKQIAAKPRKKRKKRTVKK